MAQDLTPQQILAVLSARNARTQEEYNAILAAAGLGGGNPLEYRESQNFQHMDNTGDSSPVLGAPNRQITQQIGSGGSSTGSNTWDPTTGKYTGLSSGMSENAQMLMALTMLAGGAYGAYAAGGGAGASAGAAGGMSGMDLAADAGMGSINSGGGGLWNASGGVSGMDLAADGGMGSVSGGGSSLGSAGTVAGTSAGSSALTNAGTNAATNAGTKLLTDNAGGIVGSVLGALDSGDKTQTQNRDPWGPAQPYLKGLLGEGADLYNQYKQQPFSQAEQTGYGNVGNVLDYINANAGGLLSGFQANASGANQFQRGNPRKSLIGASYDPSVSPVSWRPGLLSSFGTKKG